MAVFDGPMRLNEPHRDTIPTLIRPGPIMGILFPRNYSDGSSRSPLSGCGVRVIIALVIAGFSLYTYWRARSPNPVTGQMQHVNLTVDEEIALGLNAAAGMAAEFGGLTPDQDARLKVDDVGHRILDRSEASKAPYKFAFNALA